MSTVATAEADAALHPVLAEGRRVLRTEAEAVASLAGRLDAEFVRAVELVASCRGRVVVSGVGKSGIVARKVAATLTSIGTPAVFLHPVEGLHGDLGIVGPSDVMVLLSKSGSTAELEGVLEFAKAGSVPVVALVGAKDSPLGRRAAAAIDCGVAAEACPMDLAPTSSTTAAMAAGDALAVAVLGRREFRPEDFARIHPGGALGRRLTLQVGDVMESARYPSVSSGAVAREIVVPLARMRGTVPVVDEVQQVVGVVTAGDLTRLMERTDDFLDVPVAEFMTRSPRLASPNDLAAAALRRMQEHGIMAMPVVGDAGALAGVVHLHDLLRAGAA